MQSLLKKNDGDLPGGAEGKTAMINLIGDLRAKKKGDVQSTDPSAGLILTQGHYLLHLVYWFILAFQV